MPKSRQPRDTRLLSKVSKMYYEENLSQQEIADKLLLSRPKVSRLLQSAKDYGIVQITVLTPPNIYPELESRIEAQFGLQEAFVVEVSEPTSQHIVTRELGWEAANYVQRTMSPGLCLGLTWGSTLRAMISALQPLKIADMYVIQLVGGLGPPDADVHASDLCRRMAQLFDSKLTLLPSPGIVDSLQAKEILLSDSHVQQAVDKFSEVNVAFVGIGVPTPDSLVMRDGSILLQADLDHLLSLGAVGDISLRFFDAEGQPIISDVDDRVIGVSLEELQNIDRVVGIAGGPEKLKAIHSALKGKFLDVLITDHITATNLISST